MVVRFHDVLLCTEGTFLVRVATVSEQPVKVFIRFRQGVGGDVHHNVIP